SLLIPGAITGHPALFVGLSAGAVLTVVALGDVLLHRNYGQANEPRRWPRQPVSPALLTTGIVSLAVLLGVAALVAFRQAAAGLQATWPATAWTSAVTTLFATIPVALARRRRSIPATVPGLDAALRAITIHRVVRTMA
ncbi:hypothetical protein, partial [Escherichia coli]|uniref:hypothetical protein n=1 Tax=Escherichia coli TaxID=562 RepID=UPI0032E506D7